MRHYLPLLIAALACSPAGVAQENLLVNPGFEEPLGDNYGVNNFWSASGIPLGNDGQPGVGPGNPPLTFERSDREAFTGSWSGRAFNRSEQFHGPFYNLSQTGLLGDGGVFAFSARVKADDAEGQQLARMVIQIDDDREACPAELPPGIEWCFCYDLTSTNKSCLFGADSKPSDASTWAELSWTGRITFVGTVRFYLVQFDTQEGGSFPDLYIDDASVIRLVDIFDDDFEPDP